jgi:glycosyltransferase involved in cell wall biosynthesis
VYGGTSKITPAFAAALGRQGWAVDIVTTDANGPDRLAVPFRRWIERDGGRVRFFSRFGRWEFKLSLRMFAWLLWHVRDYEVVLVTSNFNFPVLACALACRVRDVPYVINPQGMLEPWALRYKAWKKRMYYDWIERPLVLRGARLIQALNAREAENIRSLRIGPSVVALPNGIDPEEAAHGTPEEREAFLIRFPSARNKTLILFLHRVDPKKGLDVLARAYAMVRGQFPFSHVIVAGPDNVNFTETARRFFVEAGCGSSEAVTFTGMLGGQLKRGAFAAASVFVAPSYSEGFSMSVLEAMAAGLPCVITTGCNFTEAAQAGVARETRAEAGVFSDALRDLLADPASAQAMGAHAREFVLANYTWDQIALMATRIYNPPWGR